MARAFQSDDRGFEAQRAEKFRCPGAPGPQDPGDLGVVAHHPMHQGAADTAPLVLLGNDHHGQVTVGQTVTDASGKADDLPL